MKLITPTELSRIIEQETGEPFSRQAVHKSLDEGMNHYNYDIAREYWADEILKRPTRPRCQLAKFFKVDKFLSRLYSDYNELANCRFNGC